MTNVTRTAELRKPFLGHWRIVSADLSDHDHLDLCGEARLVAPAEGWGEIAFGAFVAGLEFSFSPGTLFFDWQGNDETDESTEQGCMELIGADKAEIELEYDCGDEAVLQAVRISREVYVA